MREADYANADHDATSTARFVSIEAAIARAGRVLGEPAYLAAAEKNLEFIRSKLWDEEEGRLYHRWRDGERDTAQLLETHAFFLEGLIDYYEVTLDPDQLEFATKVATRMIDAFYDKKGGFHQSAGADDLIMRVKDYYDGAEPSGNSVAAHALLRLAKITDQKKFSDPAEQTLKHFAGRIRMVSQAVPYMLTGGAGRRLSQIFFPVLASRHNRVSSTSSPFSP